MQSAWGVPTIWQGLFAEIQSRGAKPAGDANAFDAREVIANVGASVTRPM